MRLSPTPNYKTSRCTPLFLFLSLSLSLMAISVESPAPTHLTKESKGSMGSSPLLTPSSDKRFWSTLRSRVDALLEERKCGFSSVQTESVWESDLGNRLKADSLLLLRGFDSISHSLSQLTNNLDNALQGARSLAKPPTFTDIFHCNLEKSKGQDEDTEKDDSEEESKRKLKRKLNGSEGSEDQGGDSQRENEQSPEEGKLKKAKNLAISMAKKAASLAQELKSIKSDLCFMQERCALLEEENSRLREGFAKGIRPEEDDLVRLQLEALLAEKSRLAFENANLTRENQCLGQLVQYHQLTSHDLSATYEQFIQGMYLDFSTPPPSIPEEADGGDRDCNDANKVAPETPRTKILGLPTVLDESYDEQEQ